MHTHIIINEDIGIHLVIYSEEEDIDLISAMEQLIVEELACYAQEGV